MIDWRTSYHDLCSEIDILQLREQDLEIQATLARKTVFSGEMPSDQHYCRIPLDKALRFYDDAMERLIEVRQVIQLKESIKVQMEERMNQFEGLEYKVTYMRQIKGMGLSEIADELHISYHYVAKILSSHKVKKYKNCTRNLVS